MSRLANIFARTQEQYGVWFGRVVILLLLSIIFFVTGGGISHNQKWRIEHINISGTKTIDSEVVRSLVRQKLEGKYYFVYARENSYLFPKSEIEKMLLETFPRIRNVSVVRTDDHGILVDVTERTPYALWCSDENVEKKCWFIDDRGYVFDPAPLFSKAVYVEFYGKLLEKKIDTPTGGTLPLDAFTRAKTFVKLLRENISEPYRVKISDGGEMETTILSSVQYPYLADVTIRFKNEPAPEILLKRLTSALFVQFPNSSFPKKKLLYIDMRFGNKVIFGSEN